MCVCTVLSSYCWRSFNFSALEEGPLLEHKHIQELGSAKSALHTFKFRNETPIATSSNCCVLSDKQSKPQRYSIYHHFQQILTYFMKNWTQRMFFVSLVFEMKTLQLWNLIQPKPVFSELCKTPVAFFLRTVIKKKCFLVLQKEHALFNPRMYHFILKLKKKIQH